MCYTGGPYCYGHVEKQVSDTIESIKQHDTREKRSKLMKYLARLDATEKGIKELTQDAEKARTEGDSHEYNEVMRRLEAAEKTYQNQQILQQLKKESLERNKPKPKATKQPGRKKTRTDIAKEKAEEYNRMMEEAKERSKNGYVILSLKESSRLAKLELESRFPNTKFSVRMANQNTFYPSLQVSYDNPNLKREKVMDVIYKYRGSQFNGMTDNHDPLPPFDYNGTSYSSSFVYTSAHLKPNT